MKKKRIVVFASGRGSNFRAVYSALYDKKTIPNAHIVGLITDRKGTPAESFAREQKLDPIIVIDYSSYPSRDLFEQATLDTLMSLYPDLILTLGYMRLIPKKIIAKFKHKIINIHPSLLPAFPGLHAQQQALAYGVCYSGATAHFVDEGLDTGPIIGQKIVAVTMKDTEDSLSARILEKEHELIVEVVDLFCRDHLEIVGRQVKIQK